MLLSEKYKILFIEIPKTASTVVGSALNNILGKKNVLHILDRFDNTKYNHVYRHCPINNAFLDFPESKEYFKFCFVRNPWDLQVSQYHFNKYVLNYKIPDFSTWLKSNIVVQMEWIKDFSNFDFIGTFETLQGDFDYICSSLGLPLQQLEYANSSKHKHYSEYYDQDSYSLVANLCKSEIFHFDYFFENY